MVQAKVWSNGVRMSSGCCQTKRWSFSTSSRPWLRNSLLSKRRLYIYEEATNNDEYLKYVEDEDYAKAWATFQEVILGDGGFSEDQLMKFVWHGGAKQGFPQYNGAWSHETAEKFAFRWGKLLFTVTSTVDPS